MQVLLGGDGGLTFLAVWVRAWRRRLSGSSIRRPGGSIRSTCITASRWPIPIAGWKHDVRSSPEVADWVAAENKVTFRLPGAIPQREKIRRRLTELWNFAQYSSPLKEGGRYYYFKNDGLQNQAVLYVAGLAGRPAARAAGPQPVVQGRHDRPGRPGGSSDDGRYLAYGRAEAGSRLVHLARAWRSTRPKLLPDELKWTKFSAAAWTKDGKGFFYSRYEEPQDGRRVPGPELQQQALLPPPRHAAVGRRAGLFPARASRLALRRRGDARTAATW